LLRIYASKKLLNWAANFNTGQQMVDSLVGLDIARAYQQQKLDPDAEPIPAQLQTTLKQQESGLLRQVGNSIVKDILNSAEEKFGGLIILSGEPGCGKSTILQRVVRETERNSLLVSCPKEGIDGLLGEMARKLHIEAEQPSRRIIFQELRRKEIDLLLIDDVHRLVRPYVGGQVQLDQLSELIAENPDLLVVLSLNTSTWQFILCARDQRIFDRDALIIQPWSSDQIGSLVKESYTTAEIEPNFSRVIVPRQYDNSNFDDPQDRYFSAFVRMLHSASMGNPKVAMGLWINSLYLDKSGEIFVQLPEIPPSDELDQSSLNALLLLRVICQAETISFEDIVNSLQMPAAVTLAALRNAQHKDWVVAIEDDYYQLNWYWRRVITRVLARKNLMPRFQ
jgi:hypothetical protein